MQMAVKKNTLGGCFFNELIRYKRWKAGDGRAPREPGQVRKEAAVTSYGAGRCQSSIYPHILLETGVYFFDQFDRGLICCANVRRKLQFSVSCPCT
jgi:hypothetical protein